MKSTRRRIFIFFWIAFCIYLISLILPYSIKEIADYYGGQPVIEKVYDNGIDSVIPVFCVIPILILTVLIYVKHTNITRWITFVLSSLMIFPILPLLYFVTTFCLWCKSYPGIGFYLNCVAFILFLITAIIKFRIPAEKSKQAKKVDVLDDFN